MELLPKKGMPFQVPSQNFNAIPYLFVFTLLPLLSVWQLFSQALAILADRKMFFSCLSETDTQSRVSTWQI